MSIAEIFRTMEDGPAPAETAAALAWIAGLGDRAAGQADPFEVRNRTTGAVLARLARATPETADAALAAARAAARPGDTGGALRRLAALLDRDRGRIAALDAMETGLPVRVAAETDLPLLLGALGRAAALADLTTPAPATADPVALILPAAAPLRAMARHLPAALAAGRALVLAPAPGATLAALALAELAAEAGLPVAALTGDAGGLCLAARPGTGLLAATGAAAELAALRLAAPLAPKVLDATGPEAVVIAADADLDSAVEAVADALGLSGGRAGLRVYVQEGLEPALIQRLTRRLAALRPGDPLDARTDLAVLPPEASAAAATILQQDDPGRPRLLTGQAPADPALRTPIPAPVVALCSFRTLPEAAALVDDGRQVLRAQVWTADLAEALWLARHLRAAEVAVNGAAPVGLPDAGLLAAFAPPPDLPALTDAPDQPEVAVGPAVAAALGAAPGWAAATPSRRAAALRAFAAALPDPAAAQRMTLWAARAETRQAGAEQGHLAFDDPLGVLAILMPADPTPLAVAACLGPALAAGNAVVLRAPAGLAALSGPLSAAGLPVALVTGGDRALVRHGGVDAVWAFGGAVTGQRAEEAAAPEAKPVWAPAALDWGDPAPGAFDRHACRRRRVSLPPLG